MITKTTRGKYQKQEAQQQQHSSRWRELFKDRPHELLRRMPEAVPAGVLWCPGLKVAVIEAVAGTSIPAKLLPQLTEFKSLGDSHPESIELHKKLGPAGCVWRRRAGRGLCLRGIHTALREQPL